MTMHNAAAYVRMSEADDTLGITRQIKGITHLAAQRGHHISRIYTDNDVSATSGKPRPDYEQMLETIRAGGHDGVIVWDLDRLHRQPKELEEFIDLADTFGLALANVGGDVDLSTPQGRLTARIKGAVAKHEAEQLARRVRAKQLELAQAGKDHGGRRPYGYLHDRITPHTHPFCTLGSRETIQGEAHVVAELARRIVDGDSLYVLAKDLNQRGVHTATGARWDASTIKGILLSPRIAGLRQHRGEVIGAARWPALVDMACWETVTAILSDPSRRAPGTTNTRKHLLSGIAYCGVCGGKLRAALPGMPGGAWRYQCPHAGCRKISINLPKLDKLVEKLVIGRAEQGKIRPYDADADDATEERLGTELAAVKARLEQAGREFGKDKTMPPEVLRGMVTELAAERDRLQSELDELHADRAWSDPLDGIEPSELRALWDSDELTLVRKRGIIARVTADSLTVFPATRRGRGFDPDRVSVLAWEPWRRRGTVNSSRSAAASSSVSDGASASSSATRSSVVLTGLPVAVTAVLTGPVGDQSCLGAALL